jgi:hypothetical protein
MKLENHDHFLLLLDKLYLIEREPESEKNKNLFKKMNYFQSETNIP